jgi:protein involved in polysaccharide export with SLBB domain
MNKIRLTAVPLACLLALAAGATRAAAQQSDDATVTRTMASRDQLEGIASRGDGNSASAARARLTAGDFRPGDRIMIQVQGDTALTDTFAVWQDGALHLPSPVVGTLPLQGVLRSEIQQKVQTFVARFVRNPVVLARPLIRLSFQGDFAHSGFYAVPADAPLADAFMAAGGTTTTANMDKVKIERGGRDFLNTRAVQTALAQNQTVDELGLRDGDQLIVPKGGGTSVWNVVRGAALVTSLGVGVLTLSKRM